MEEEQKDLSFENVRPIIQTDKEMYRHNEPRFAFHLTFRVDKSAPFFLTE